ncbi:hypothetical protein PHAVU_004G079700, partial [Phaseolus vulgaris]
HGVTPDIAIKARCVCRSTHQVSIEIEFTQGKTLVIRWLLRASQKCLDRNMAFKLSFELVNVTKASSNFAGSMTPTLHLYKS